MSFRLFSRLMLYISITFSLLSKFQSTFLCTNFYIRFEFSEIKYSTNILIHFVQ